MVAVSLPQLVTHPFFFPDTLPSRIGLAVVMILFCGVGVTLRVRRPGSLVGPSLLGIGLLGLLIGALNTPRTDTISEWLPMLMAPLLATALLAHPDGRLEDADARMVRGLWWAGGALFVVGIGSWDPRPATCVPACGRPFGLVYGADSVATIARGMGAVVTVVLAIYIAVRATQRWRAASGPARLTLGPVVWSASALVLLGLVQAAVAVGDPELIPSDPRALVVPALALVAGSFLFGELRARLSFGMVGGLVGELERGGRIGALEDLMQRRLHDPELAIGFWMSDEDRYVAVDGTPFTLDTSDHRVTTPITASGEPVAVVRHDPAVDRGLVQMVGSAAALAFRNERLHAELRARLQEVRESRARIAAAAERARREVERDVHDGAQQRLVSLSMALRIVDDNAPDSLDPTTVELLRQARIEADAAIEDLRTLTSGLHPVLLTDAGIAAAVQRIADGSPMVVDVSIPPDRYSEEIEGCAYFVIAECITNAAKHADATRVAVSVHNDDSSLRLVVTDDGRGGADSSKGTGIRGLEDRVAALGGHLSVVSPPGDGTTVEAVVPCE